MFEKPGIADLRKAAQQLGMNPSDDYLRAVDEIVAPLADAYAALDAMPDEVPAVKYPRGQDTARSGDENRYGAWYVKTSIKGAPGGKLAGRRVALKDNVCLAGVPMMIGADILGRLCARRRRHHRRAHSRCRRRNRRQGGVRILLRVRRQPHQFDRAGAESAQAAATPPAARRRAAPRWSRRATCDMAIGGDQAGSIRIPASFCGIVGLKPTFGLVPYTGIGPLEMTLDVCGPMTANVRDNALLLEVIAGPDGIDSRQRGVAAGHYTAALDGGVKGLRIGVLKEGFGLHNSEPDVDAHVRDAARAFREPRRDGRGGIGADARAGLSGLGGDPRRRRLRHAAGNERRRHQSRGSLRLEPHGQGDGLAQPRRRFRRHLKIASIFSKYTVHRYGGHYYGKAQNLRRRLRAAYDAALATHDLLLLPTTPMKATPIPNKDATPQEITRRSWEATGNTCPFNVTGHPAISLPCGMEDGRPIGMMLVGRAYDEATIYRAAAAFERSGDWTKF